MIDASAFEQKERLKNGAVVTIRAVRVDDKNKIVEAFHNLEPESIYTRFFQHKKELTDQELKAATEVDFISVVALVVTIDNGENETVIGACRYAMLGMANEPKTAEVSFTVEEDYHGLGIASCLLKHLARIAREKGVSRFVAEVLPANRAMLAVFSRSGLPMQKQSDGLVTHVTLRLHSSPDATASPGLASLEKKA